MDGVKDLAAIIGLHNHLRMARSVLVDDAHKTYGQIDECITPLARGRATWVTRGRVEVIAEERRVNRDHLDVDALRVHVGEALLRREAHLGRGEAGAHCIHGQVRSPQGAPRLDAAAPFVLVQPLDADPGVDAELLAIATGRGATRNPSRTATSTRLV